MVVRRQHISDDEQEEILSPNNRSPQNGREAGDHDDEQEELFSLGNYQITTSPSDFNTKTLVDQIKNGHILIPNFQRNYVWSMKKASGLIESIIIGLPIPQVFIFEKTRKNGEDQYLVIDGQQRLLSIFYFVHGRFPRKTQRRNPNTNSGEAMSMKGINFDDDDQYRNFNLKLPPVTPGATSMYDGKTYNDIQHKFDMRTVRSIIVQQTHPEGDEAMYEIFRRLNTGGENLRPQEIRKCIYDSKFYHMLDDANREEKWRKFIGKEIPEIRMDDIQTLLRGFAMLVKGDDYKSSLVRFLNKFSDEARSFNQIKINYLKKLLFSFLENNGSNSEHFYINQKFSQPIFESVFAAACRDAYLDEKAGVVKIDAEQLVNLKNDAEFKKATERQTTSTRNVKTRLELARKILTGKGQTHHTRRTVGADSAPHAA